MTLDIEFNLIGTVLATWRDTVWWNVHNSFVLFHDRTPTNRFIYIYMRYFAQFAGWASSNKQIFVFGVSELRFANILVRISYFNGRALFDAVSLSAFVCWYDSRLGADHCFGFNFGIFCFGSFGDMRLIYLFCFSKDHK